MSSNRKFALFQGKIDDSLNGLVNWKWKQMGTFKRYLGRQDLMLDWMNQKQLHVFDLCNRHGGTMQKSGRRRPHLAHARQVLCVLFGAFDLEVMAFSYPSGNVILSKQFNICMWNSEQRLSLPPG
jgi:hypothetical protein